METALTQDFSCMVGMTAQQMDGSPPIPAVHPAYWYEAPTDANLIKGARDLILDNRVMASITVCGPDVGRFVAVVAEDGVPFWGAYGSTIAPRLDGHSKAMINDRNENAIPILKADGTLGETAAGKLRFGHSPDFMQTEEELEAFHADEDGALARFRLVDVRQGSSTLLLAVGGVLPSVRINGNNRPTTWADINQLSNAEVSPEWFETPDGRMHYMALSIVAEGNTRTTLSASREHIVASLRPHTANTESTETVTEETEDHTGCVSCTVRAEEDAAAAEAARAEMEAAREARLEELTNKLDALTADHEALVSHLMTQTAER